MLDDRIHSCQQIRVEYVAVGVQYLLRCITLCSGQTTIRAAPPSLSLLVLPLPVPTSV